MDFYASKIQNMYMFSTRCGEQVEAYVGIKMLWYVRNKLRPVVTQAIGNERDFLINMINNEVEVRRK